MSLALFQPCCRTVKVSKVAGYSAFNKSERAGATDQIILSDAAKWRNIVTRKKHCNQFEANYMSFLFLCLATGLITFILHYTSAADLNSADHDRRSMSNSQLQSDQVQWHS